jgi:hypothetical protein
MIFFSFRIFFSDNTRVRIFIVFVASSQISFPEFNIRLYDKNSESDYFCFPPPKLFLDSVGGGTWPFSVDGVICLVNSDSKQDTSLLPVNSSTILFGTDTKCS